MDGDLAVPRNPGNLAIPSLQLIREVWKDTHMPNKAELWLIADMDPRYSGIDTPQKTIVDVAMTCKFSSS
jgi:hypothetical protein